MKLKKRGRSVFLSAMVMFFVFSFLQVRPGYPCDANKDNKKHARQHKQKKPRQSTRKSTEVKVYPKINIDGNKTYNNISLNPNIVVNPKIEIEGDKIVFKPNNKVASNSEANASVGNVAATGGEGGDGGNSELSSSIEFNAEEAPNHLGSMNFMNHAPSPGHFQGTKFDGSSPLGFLPNDVDRNTAYKNRLEKNPSALINWLPYFGKKFAAKYQPWAESYIDFNANEKRNPTDKIKIIQVPDKYMENPLEFLKILMRQGYIPTDAAKYSGDHGEDADKLFFTSSLKLMDSGNKFCLFLRAGSKEVAVTTSGSIQVGGSAAKTPGMSAFRLDMGDGSGETVLKSELEHWVHLVGLIYDEQLAQKYREKKITEFKRLTSMPYFPIYFMLNSSVVVGSYKQNDYSLNKMLKLFFDKGAKAREYGFEISILGSTCPFGKAKEINHPLSVERATNTILALIARAKEFDYSKKQIAQLRGLLPLGSSEYRIKTTDTKHYDENRTAELALVFTGSSGQKKIIFAGEPNL